MAATAPSLRRNFVAGLSGEALWNFGHSFAAFETILMVYLARAGAPTPVVGLLPTVNILGYALPQILVARRYGGRAQAKRLFVLWNLPTAMALIAMGGLAHSTGWPAPTWAVAAFLAFLGASALATGVSSPLWTELSARLFPQQARGRYYGSVFLVDGVTGMLGYAVAARLLAALPGPTNFALCMACAGVLTAVAAGAWSFYGEPRAEERCCQESLRHYAVRLCRLVAADRNFCRFVLIKGFLGLAYMGPAFIAPYAVKRFSLPDSAAAWAGILLFIPGALTSLLWGRLGERRGYLGLSVASAFVGLAACLAAAAADSWPLTVPGLLLLGLSYSMNGVATNNIVIESSPSTERLGYIAAANVLITLPFGCAPPLGGWLADRFSFRLLFSLSAALYLIGGALLAILVRDPRRRQQT